MSTNKNDTKSTGDADFCAESRTISGQGERLRVAAYTEPQIQAFCRSHQIPRQHVVRIRTIRDLHGWRPGLLLLLPSWWLGTDSDTVPFAREMGWELAEVTEDEVLNGPTPPAPLRGRPALIDLLRKVTGDPMAEPTPPAPVEETAAGRLYDEAMRFREGPEIINQATTPPAERPTPVSLDPMMERALRAEKELAEARDLIAVKDQSINAANQTIMLNNELMRQATDKLAEVREQRDRLAEALREAEAGLVFAGADKEPEGQFIPSPTLALRIVREALKSIEP